MNWFTSIIKQLASHGLRFYQEKFKMEPYIGIQYSKQFYGNDLYDIVLNIHRQKREFTIGEISCNARILSCDYAQGLRNAPVESVRMALTVKPDFAVEGSSCVPVKLTVQINDLDSFHVSMKYKYLNGFFTMTVTQKLPLCVL